MNMTRRLSYTSLINHVIVTHVSTLIHEIFVDQCPTCTSVHTHIQSGLTQQEDVETQFNWPFNFHTCILTLGQHNDILIMAHQSQPTCYYYYI